MTASTTRTIHSPAQDAFQTGVAEMNETAQSPDEQTEDIDRWQALSDSAYWLDNEPDQELSALQAALMYFPEPEDPMKDYEKTAVYELLGSLVRNRVASIHNLSPVTGVCDNEGYPLEIASVPLKAKLQVPDKLNPGFCRKIPMQKATVGQYLNAVSLMMADLNKRVQRTNESFRQLRTLLDRSNGDLNEKVLGLVDQRGYDPAVDAGIDEIFGSGSCKP